MPKYVDHTVETFVAAIKRDFENSTLKKQPIDNVTLGERKPLHDLQMRHDIIITKQTKVVQLSSGMLKITLSKQKRNQIIKHSTES